jgi:hypothetical protein
VALIKAQMTVYPGEFLLACDEMLDLVHLG